MQNTLINTTDQTTNSYVLVNGAPSFVIAKQSNFRSDKITYTKQLNNNISNYFSLNLTIPIFNSLQVRNNVRLNRIEAKRLLLIEQTTKTQLQQDIERAWLNMTSAFERYKIILEQVAAYTESFKAAEIRFNEGVGTSIDYLTAKNRLDAANINLIVVKYDYVLRTRILDYYQGKAGW
jgi:outer membrane protein